MVTRMDPQKGIDLAVEAVRSLLGFPKNDTPAFQAVFLGTGDPKLESATRQLEHDFPTQVRSKILFDEHLSCRIYAGADALLMPSRYEPCGLSQMISMRYGCIPIAHATGGLKDTIHDPTHAEQPTGYLFDQADSKSLAKTIRRALKSYSNYPKAWRDMQISGMQQNFSWDHSAREYLKLYKLLLH
jgi:starch synthase